MTQCRQVALFSTQVENGMFVNAHLLTTLHKLMYQNQQFFSTLCCMNLYEKSMLNIHMYAIADIHIDIAVFESF